MRCLVGAFVAALSKSVARQQVHGDAVRPLAVCRLLTLSH